MRENDVQLLIDELTSFYKDFLPVNSAFETLLRAYIESFEQLWNDVTYHRENLVVDNAPLLKRIPFAKLDIQKAVYSKEVALSIKEYELEELISYLNKTTNYVELFFTEPTVRVPLIYSMNLKVNYQDASPLILFEDYFMRDNRIYFLPNFILNNTKQISVLYAEDIRVNYFTLEQKWGHLFGVETEDLLPRYQYRDILRAFMQLMQSDLTIKDIKAAIRLATKWDGFELVDIKTANLPVHIKRLYEDWLLSPADFVITLREHMIKDKILLNVLLSLLDEAKEVQTHYLILFLIFRKDILEFSEADTQKQTYWFEVPEKTYQHDASTLHRKLSITDYLTQPYRYDVDRHYDFLMTYDEEGPDANRLLTMDDPMAITDAGIFMDAPWYFHHDNAVVRVVEDPKIPRNLIVIDDAGMLSFLFDENRDSATEYELYGATVLNGPYELLETVHASEDSIQEINHNAQASGMRYYKIRAKNFHENSFFTLAIDRTTL